IEQKVSYSDYNGAEIVSRINQTPTTVTIEAEKINLDGITRVNSALWVGEPFDYSGDKAINFRSAASINSPAGSDSLIIDCMGEIFLHSGLGIRFDLPGGGRTTTIDFSTAYRIIWGDNAPTYCQNADMLDGYHASAFSFSGHVHSDYEYVKPSSGQAIRLGIYTTGQRLNLYLGGSLIGYIPYTPA
ncbi:hypothetical protein SAMN05192569_10691, partial [Parageobacillus thermantarcticus]